MTAKNEEGYSIITVNADDNDEVVIQAGITQASREAQGEVQAETFANQGTSVEINGDFSAEKPALETHQKTVDSLDKPSGKPHETYAETTLDDLKEIGPLPKTRIAVIAAAILFIVGFLLYNLVMR